MKCRHCGAPLTHSFLDLGSAPPSNAYLRAQDLQQPELWFPLRVMVCDHCWLVQTEDFADRGALFTHDYAYFSSMSSSWLAHAQAYVEAMRQRFGLTEHSHVVEVASNDGYLLRHVQAAGIPCLGIEPTTSTADAARALGLEVIERFFGQALAEELAAAGKQADLMAANNVLAHVPDINDFVAGFRVLLKPHGVATFEFPHLKSLIEHVQFDTVYHEHYSYLSLLAVQAVCAQAGLTVFDVQTLATHGGSLRVFVQRTEGGVQPIDPSVAAMIAAERAAGMDQLSFYQGFQRQAEAVKNGLLSWLLACQASGKTVAAYGAAAKGNTLLNFAGVRSDLLSYVVDRSPGKCGRYLPGSRIPIVAEARLSEHKPDYIVILPWNLRSEISAQLDYARVWEAQFVTVVPRLEVF